MSSDTSTERRRTIELVVPVLNEEGNLRNFLDAATRIFAQDLKGYAWKILFIDDGSRDTSWGILQELSRAHANIRAIRLNRNYGSHLAISAGLAHATGDACVILAADLQDPPETIPGFVAEWEKGFRVVWGVRSGRIEAFHRKLFSRVFHAMVKRYALPTYPSQGTGSFCLIDRSVVRNLRRMRENFRTIFGLITIQGYPSAEVAYVRRDRSQGASGWTFRRMLRTSVDVFTSYSHLPVRTVTWVGVFSCTIAIVGVMYQLTRYFRGLTIPGWTLMFAAVCFFGGVQTLALGFLGEYIWRTFHEVKRRPLWFVEETTFREKP